MRTSREITKLLIETSPTVEEADRVIYDIYELETVKEKIAFLKGMYGVDIIGHENQEPNETTYFAMLNSIIND